MQVYNKVIKYYKKAVASVNLLIPVENPQKWDRVLSDVFMKHIHSTEQMHLYSAVAIQKKSEY